MKKFNLFLVFILGLAKASSGQIDWGKYSQSYEVGVTEKSGFGLITAVLSHNDSFWNSYSDAGLLANLRSDTSFSNHRRSDFTTISLFDTSKAHFFMHGINPVNARDYEYRIIQNHTAIIVPWSAVKTFTNAVVGKSSGLGQMAYLGGYRAAYGAVLIADVRRKETGEIVSTAVVQWQKIKPRLLDIYTANELDDFLNRLSHNGAYNAPQEDVAKWTKRYPANLLDPISSLPKKLIVKPTDNNLIFYLKAEIKDRKLIEYEVIKDGKVYRDWKKNDFDNNFIWLKNLPPGNYYLKFRYSVQPENITTYPFQIRTAWYQSTGFKIIGGSLIAAFCGFILFIMLWIRQRQKVVKELSKKTMLQLELQAIHSQLNPHFVFNALSSIQGLINKNDIAGANSYLSDFARLLRNSLSNSNREQTPLKEEIKTLETYLKLEQLRFNFKYDIAVDNTINVYETEIPSLLLQPLIENAIKHGISALKEAGRITLTITRNKNNMNINLKDNGSGFALYNNTNGLGLKLTRDRIKLLNEMMKGQEINFEINTSPGQHTIIHLSFNNWFNEN